MSINELVVSTQNYLVQDKLLKIQKNSEVLIKLSDEILNFGKK